MNPKITVIVPYHNERESVEFTLEQVGLQSLPAEVAVFVNSFSTDDTFDVVGSWIQNNKHRFSTKFLNVFENTNNPASSKNVGIRHANTDWLAFMDCGQRFETDWLEQQVRYLEKNEADLVSGVVYLVGENWVDRCAVAQTYGYKRCRACVPTTLLKKSIFERTGPFLEGRRSGYDVAWLIKLKTLGIKRPVNEAVRINYIGVNFAANLSHLLKKSILYAKHSLAIEGYLTPYFYVLFFLVFLGTLILSPSIALALFVSYFLARASVIPVVKSGGVVFIKEHPFEALFGLGIVGLVIDTGKLIGIFQGLHHYFLASRAAPEIAVPAVDSPALNIDSAVVAGFSDEWKRFPQDKLPPEEQKQVFESYFSIFPWSSLGAQSIGADIGCGSGRWAKLAAGRCARLHVVDAGAGVLEVARNNLSGQLNVSFHHASVGQLPFPDSSLDFAYSLGVLHHVPDHAAAIREIARTLKPGAPFLVYLYYAFDNRPVWFRAIWRVTNFLRVVVSRLPHAMRYGTCQLIAATVYWPMARMGAWLESLGHMPDAWPLAFYRDKSFYTMRTDALDRFGTRLEKRFTRLQIRTLLEQSGFTDVRFSDKTPFWCALALRGTSAISPQRNT